MLYSLPKSFSQYEDEISLKYAIWKQIQEKFEKLKRMKLCSQNLDTTIVEINLGLSDNESFNILQQIDELNQQIEVLNIKRNKDHPDQNPKWVKKINKVQAKLGKLIKSYHENHGHVDPEEKFYDKIRMLFITFKSMEARDKLMEYVLHRDSKLLTDLRDFWQSKIRPSLKVST